MELYLVRVKKKTKKIKFFSNHFWIGMDGASGRTRDIPIGICLRPDFQYSLKRAVWWIDSNEHWFFGLSQSLALLICWICENRATLPISEHERTFSLPVIIARIIRRLLKLSASSRKFVVRTKWKYIFFHNFPMINIPSNGIIANKMGWLWSLSCRLNVSIKNYFFLSW